MRSQLGTALLLGLLVGCSHAAKPALHSSAQRPVGPVQVVEPAQPIMELVKVVPRPRIEVVFALDTTGSMDQLIEGAKRKIWAIADELASAQPQPELSIGLVAYRDRGDAYVTQHYPLSSDLDAVYQQLSALAAAGGGDGPESVNQALYEAVHNSAWTDSKGAYRTVFLVGDAPPHEDYANDVPYQNTIQAALARGIVINTVQCGNQHDTTPIWTAIAQRTQGSYASIEQSGGMQQIAAPMDAEIDRLNAQLNETVLPYGAVEQQKSVREKARVAASAPAAASASRQAFLNKKGGGIVTGAGDLLDDVRTGRVDASKLSRDELPSELRDLAPEARTQALQRRSSERAKIKSQLDSLVKERSAYVRAEEQKQRASGVRDGFDGEVMRAVKTQAKERAGLVYKE